MKCYNNWKACKEKEIKKQNKAFTQFGLNSIIECDIYDKLMIVKAILINLILTKLPLFIA